MRRTGTMYGNVDGEEYKVKTTTNICDRCGKGFQEHILLEHLEARYQKGLTVDLCADCIEEYRKVFKGFMSDRSDVGQILIEGYQDATNDAADEERYEATPTGRRPIMARSNLNPDFQELLESVRRALDKLKGCHIVTVATGRSNGRDERYDAIDAAQFAINALREEADIDELGEEKQKFLTKVGIRRFKKPYQYYRMVGDRTIHYSTEYLKNHTVEELRARIKRNISLWDLPAPEEVSDEKPEAVSKQGAHASKEEILKRILLWIDRVSADPKDLTPISRPNPAELAVLPQMIDKAVEMFRFVTKNRPEE